ncbi:winged helix-turn-helix domain-containing protein [Undibacterium sp. WLHG33]|uniref:winged helix-turn-helix domain-containing protein n=1 Tax=Undibacterium sp. WLHG33 TaxID=3412482 RepID=UPI003C3078A0
MPTTISNQQTKRTLANIMLYVLEAIHESGLTGAPGGIIYAALMQQGATLDQFNTLMGCLVKAGNVTHEDQVYRITKKGEGAMMSLDAACS